MMSSHLSIFHNAIALLRIKCRKTVDTTMESVQIRYIHIPD